eukprot:UN13659
MPYLEYIFYHTIHILYSMQNNKQS